MGNGGEENLALLRGEGHATEAVVGACPVDCGDAGDFGGRVVEAVGEGALGLGGRGEGVGRGGAGRGDGGLFGGEGGGDGALGGGGDWAGRGGGGGG